MRERNQEIHVLLLPEEMERIKQKMAELGIINRSAYVRKMALDGYCINLDLTDMKEMVSLLRRCSNNLNQYAKRANESGSIYAEDIRDLQVRQSEIWEIAKEMLARLATIQ
ncbi:plasmid mobilization protein [Stomatobaculum longum]|jgi:bacterial mobilization protein MobC|uniref:plasmid mobilization protein n=1 Tax=Stomatobaculum longum TaxID=796942 RepID=UPI0028EEA130|nr:plasmid mobilization relaxosome protein MobC [Stomatobaculum longum]